MTELVERAATVVVVRERGSAFEVLLLRRHASLAVHGGQWVFPGGKIETVDADERATAVRETWEETQLDIGSVDLVRTARWITPVGRRRRFSAAFFACQVNRSNVVVDGGEIDEHVWVAPAQAARRVCERGHSVPPPTFVTLCWLAEHAAAGDAMSALRARAEWELLPRPQATSVGTTSLLPGDVGYARHSVIDAPPRHRVVMTAAAWRYVCDLPTTQPVLDNG